MTRKSYSQQLIDVGQALQTLKRFADQNHLGEGIKARINHVEVGILANMPPVDKSLVQAQMDYSDF